MKKITIACLTCMAAFLYACTAENYETGDGDLSYLRADFVEVHTNSKAELVNAMTDDGDSLIFSSPLKVKWATTKDSTYRALLYYNKVKDKVTPFSVNSVGVPKVVPTSQIKDSVIMDPLTWESAWQSKNNQYLNLGLIIKTGVEEGVDKRHLIGVVCDTVMKRLDGTHEIHLRLYHHQNGVPLYYSSSFYMSIPVGRLPKAPKEGDEIVFTMNTFEGKVEKRFTY